MVGPQRDWVGAELASANASLAVDPVSVVAGFAVPEEGIGGVGARVAIFVAPVFAYGAEDAGSEDGAGAEAAGGVVAEEGLGDEDMGWVAEVGGEAALVGAVAGGAEVVHGAF